MCVYRKKNVRSNHVLAFLFEQLGLVATIMETAVEQLYGYHSKDELKKHVYDQNVEDVLERGHHTIEYCLQLWYTFDRL